MQDMRDFRDAKAMARTLRADLAAKGLKITIGQSLPTAASPASLNEHLCQAARKPQGAGWNANLGHGIIDPVATAVALGLLAAS
jgi:hypothetical protein